MTTVYKFKAVYTKANVAVAPASPPTITVVGSDNAVLVAALTAVTALSNLPGAYVYSYTGVNGLDPMAVFHTTDATMDKQDIYDYTPAIADLVWNEVLTGATHNVATSAGRRLRQLASSIILDGAITSSTTNTVTFDGGATTTDNLYRGNLIVVMSGTGIGQTRIIVEYDGDTKTATVDKPWVINPSALDEMIILAFAQELVVEFGTAVSVGANTIVLATGASAVDNVYRYCLIVLTSATGAETEARLITEYDGDTRTVTVSPAWTVLPGANAVYKIVPVGLAILDSTITDAISAASVSAAAVTKIQSGLATPASAWSYATRTLTQSAASVAAAVAGTTITIYRGDTMSASLTGLGSMASVSKLYFTVKFKESDADSKSVIQIERTAGLMYIAGTAGTAGNGTLTIDDSSAGNVTVTLTAAETAKLEKYAKYYYDVQIVRSTGTIVSTMTTGTFVVSEDYTRTVT